MLLIDSDIVFFCISHIRGRVFVSLANEKIVVFHRNTGKVTCSKRFSRELNRSYLDGTWNLDQFHLIVTGKSRESVRCAIQVDESYWFGVANRVYVLDVQSFDVRVTMKISLIDFQEIFHSSRNNSKFILVLNILFNTWLGLAMAYGYPFVYLALYNYIMHEHSNIYKM